MGTELSVYTELRSTQNFCETAQKSVELTSAVRVLQDIGAEHLRELAGHHHDVLPAI
jgi:hypothetical protein